MQCRLLDIYENAYGMSCTDTLEKLHLVWRQPFWIANVKRRFVKEEFFPQADQTRKHELSGAFCVKSIRHEKIIVMVQLKSTN
jgi:hypothetical protein